MFVLSTGLKYGVVTPWVALPFGTLTSLIFIIAAAVKKCGDEDWNGYVTVANFWYWLAGVLATLTDIVLRFTSPELFCVPTALDDCQKQFKALTVFWCSFAVMAVIWFYCIRKMYTWVNNNSNV